jgi:hypothetical protein
VTRQVRIQVAERQQGENLIFRRGDRETKFSDVEGLNEASLSKIVVPIPTTDKDLMEGQEITTGRLMYLETDTEMVVKLATVGDTGFTVKPVVDASSATMPGIFYLEGEFTHVYITLAGASGNANIVFGVVGA